MKRALPALWALFALFSVFHAFPAPAIQEQIDAAAAAGQAAVRIAPGIYRVRPAKPHLPHLSFQEVSNLTVDATGVTMICENASSAIWFERCRNVTLKGLVIDYDPLSLTQGTVVALAPDGTWTDVKIHAGYPEPTLERPGQGFYLLYDAATRLLKIGSCNRVAEAIEPLGDGVFRVNHGKQHAKDSAAVGDFLRLPQQWESAHGIMQNVCEAVTLEDITLHTCPGFGIVERGGSGNIYRRVRIVPGPPPPGATEPRLFSSMFDGINLAHNRVGPVVEGCELANTGDDGIAIYSPGALVLEAPDERTLVAAPAERFVDFRPGDSLRVCRFSDATLHGVKVAAVEKTGWKPEDIRKVVDVFIREAPGYLYREAWKLTLDGPVGVVPGDLCGLESLSGRGFRIGNNHVFNGGSRGIVVNQSGGVVRGNRIEHTFLPGIHMFAFLREGGSGFQEDVEISDNRIDWACRLLPGRDDWCGAICITGWDKGFQPVDGHRRLVIGNNEIRNATGVNLQIHCATDVVVRNNRFLDTHPVKTPQGRPRPVDNRAIAWVEQAADVRFGGNTVRNPGPYAAPDALLARGPGTSGITGEIRMEATQTE